jgi:hypothetical protein
LCLQIRKIILLENIGAVHRFFQENMEWQEEHQISRRSPGRSACFLLSVLLARGRFEKRCSRGESVSLDRDL